MRPPVIDGVMTYRDGGGKILREVCADTAAGKREYKRRLGVLVLRQLNRCAICHKHMQEPSFDHEAGRGLGSSHRDDRCWDDNGRPMNAALCFGCNSEKGSKRFAWIEGVYQKAA